MKVISMQIHHLTGEAIKEIKRHLTENGAIEDISGDELWTAAYVNDDGEGEAAHYQSITIDQDKLFVDLADGMCLYEDELTTNHVLDIMSIIESLQA